MAAENPQSANPLSNLDQWVDFIERRYKEGKSESEFRQCDAQANPGSRGRTLPEDFGEQLTGHLDALNRLQSLKAWGRPRTFRYWSAPSYALAHGLKKAALMKRLREMEKIARRLFPDSVPASRKVRLPLTEKKRSKRFDSAI